MSRAIVPYQQVNSILWNMGHLAFILRINLRFLASFPVTVIHVAVLPHPPSVVPLLHSECSYMYNVKAIKEIPGSCYSPQ